MLQVYGREKRWKERNERFAEEGFPREELEAVWEKNPARKLAPAPHGEYAELQEGDVLHYGGYDFQCIETGGHTPGHMCLYCKTEKLAFLGDHVLFDITPNIVWWKELPDALGTYLQNLDKVARLEIQTALPGHRSKRGTVGARVEELKRHHALRLREIEMALAAHPGLTAYETAGHISWKIRSRSWEAFPPTQKWFAVGEVMAHLEHLAVLGRVRQEKCRGIYVYFLNT